MYQYDEVLRVIALCAMLNTSRQTVWRLEKHDPTFPRRIQIGQRAYGFRRSEVEAWLSSRQAQA